MHKPCTKRYKVATHMPRKHLLEHIHTDKTLYICAPMRYNMRHTPEKREDRRMAEETVQENLENADQTEPQKDLAWALVAEAKDDDFDTLAKLIAPKEEELAPTCAQLSKFIAALKKRHATQEKRHKKTLPSLDENYWDQDSETLLCYDENKHVAQMWRKVELS